MATTKPIIPQKHIIDRLGKVDFADVCRLEQFKLGTSGVSIAEDGRVRYLSSDKFWPVLTEASIHSVEDKLGATYRHVEQGDYYLAGGHERWLHAYVNPAGPHFCVNQYKVDKIRYTLESEQFERDSGLKVGDKVSITRTAITREGGWDNGWMSLEMTAGQVGIITKIHHSQGITVKIPGVAGKYAYPYFVIEKYVEPVKATEPTVDIKIEVPPPPRRVDAGLPVQPGDFLGPSRRMKTFQSYRDSVPRMTSTSFAYYRDTWTKADYESRQAAWVQFYDIKAGSAVKVCGPATDHLDGWNCNWHERMDELVGNTYEVRSVGQNGISIRALGTTWNVPFYIPKPEPKTVVPQAPKYRMFETATEVSDWVQKHGSKIVCETFYGDVVSASVSCGMLLVNGSLQSKFKDCKSALDNTPFGVKV